MKKNPEIVFNIPEEWILLAQLDESADYEVDIIAIYQDKDTFILASASGCSCWDGDYQIEKFDSFEALSNSIGVLGDDRDYQPSIKGADKLIEEAKEKLNISLKQKLKLAIS